MHAEVRRFPYELPLKDHRLLQVTLGISTPRSQSRDTPPPAFPLAAEVARGAPAPELHRAAHAPPPVLPRAAEVSLGQQKSRDVPSPVLPQAAEVSLGQQKSRDVPRPALPRAAEVSPRSSAARREV